MVNKPLIPTRRGKVIVRALLLMCAISFCSLGSWAEPQSLRPEVCGTEFPRNTNEARWFFEGCADCFGPWYVTASGQLGKLDDFDYSPEFMNDNDLSTCWAIQGGVGSWFGFRMSRVTPEDWVPVDGIDIANGYTKSLDRWRQNSRIRQLSISIDGEEYARVTLEDTAFIQRVRFPERVNIRDGELRIMVLSIYPGSHFPDLCVSEIQISGGH